MKRTLEDPFVSVKKFRWDKEEFTEEDFQDGLDEELYANDEDRDQLASLTELEREDILAQRYDAREELKKFREKAIRDGKLKAKLVKPTSKSSALADLRSKRQRTKEIKKVEEKKSEPVKEEPTLELSMLQPIILTRKQIVKLMNQPYFEKVVTNCFVRVVIGEDNMYKRVYRLAQVDSFKEKTPYSIDDVKTNKYLVLKIGASKKSFSIAVVSNTPVHASEFSRFLTDSIQSKQSIPSLQEIGKIAKNFKDTVDNYVYTEEEVKKILDKKPIKVNMMQEKLRIVRERDMAFEEGNDEKYEQLVLELSKIEKILLDKKNKRVRGIVSEETPLEPSYDPFSDDEEEAKSDKLDPFARRPTRSQGLFVSTEPSPKEVKLEKLLSPLESPGKALQKAHDFDIDLTVLDKSKTNKNTTFLVPSQPVEGKRISLLDYKKNKNLL